jgi:hypothetical protein
MKLSASILDIVILPNRRSRADVEAEELVCSTLSLG